MRALLSSGSVSLSDIEAYRQDLLQQLAAPDESGEGPALPPTHPLLQLLGRQCLGAALISRWAA